MAFEFKLSTDEIRKKMFNFIKPIYKNTWDLDVDYINWNYGVYDNESGFFITYANSVKGDDRYVLINGNSDVFYVVAVRYQHKFIEIPEELKHHSEIIKDGIKLYNNEKNVKTFKSSFSDEQEKHLNEITENMKDKCKPGIDINCYEDAEKIFVQNDGNYHYISKMYNKNTLECFNKYLSEEKMCRLRGENYKKILSKISQYGDTLSKEDYTQISKDFQNLNRWFTHITDDMYVDMTFEAIKKAYFCGVISCGYVDFIEKYMKNCIKFFTDKIQHLRPLLDFINENMKDKNFKGLEFYKKELDKLIYNRIQGFDFTFTTDEIREKIFDFLKPEYKSKNDLDVSNINWTTGVYDKESGIFLTQIYYVSDGIARCGINYHSYIVITDNGHIFKAINNDEYEKKTYDFRIPEQYRALTDKIKEGIAFYDEFSYDYKKSLSEGITEKIKAINEIMYDRCHKNFPINCEEDARKLFELVNCSVYTITGIYNKKTISSFNEFADDDKVLMWRGDKHLELLKEVTNHFTENEKRCQYFKNACFLFRCGVNTTYDEQFFKAVSCMYDKQLMGYFDEDSLKRYINTYAEIYPDQLENIAPLIKLIDSHTKDRYLKDSIEKVKKILDKRQ
ncbi:MAG: hypothetical protein IJA12_05660 [Oscillospiraceae bacterium]|nr:hypothetical protein [Oscillospiraceae bacterium]